MKIKISPARNNIIAMAEKALGRPLTAAEQKAARGIAERVAEIWAESWTGQQIAQSLSEICAPESPVTLLESLANSTGSLADDRKRILSSLNPDAEKAITAFDMAQALENFSQWLLALLRSRTPPPTTRVLKFGLFESGNGCKLYVSGANRYDEDDPDWSKASDWWPGEHYAPLDELSKLWRALAEAGVEPWVIIQALAIILVRNFFEQHHTDFRSASGLQHVYVTSGFDDGDLYPIQTPLTPKA